MAKKRRGVRKKVLLDREKIRAARIGRGWTIENAVTEGKGAFDESTYKRAERRIAISILKAEQITAIYNAKLEDFLSNSNETHSKSNDAKGSSKFRTDSTAASVTPQAEAAVDYDDRRAARARGLSDMIAIYVKSYSSKHHLELSIDGSLILAACEDYFVEIARLKSKYLADNHRAGPYSVAALTCYMLVKYRPVSFVGQIGSLSDDQRTIIKYVNELMAIAVSSSISGILVKASSKIMTLVRLLSGDVSAEAFSLAYRLLEPDKDETP
jgi:hypothetical protein